MSTETRIVRPYLGVDKIQHSMRTMRLAVGNELYQSGAVISVSQVQFALTPIRLVLAESEDELDELVAGVDEGLKDIELMSSDTDLVVIASTPYLKMADVIFRERIDKLGSDGPVIDLNTGERPRALRAPHGGCDLDVYLCLGAGRAPVALQPWRKGTWLGRLTYRLRTDLGNIGFVPRPLSDAQKAEWGLPKGTVRYVRLEDSPLDATVGEESVELWVDEDVLSRLSVAPDAPAARTFQLQLFLDTVSTIIRVALTDSELSVTSPADLEGSLLDRLLRMVTPREANEANNEYIGRLDITLDLLRKHPERFVAIVEDHCKYRTQLLGAIEQ